MNNFIANVSPKKAALMVGISFIASVVIVTVVDDFLLPNFVIPGDTSVLAEDIAADQKTFVFAAIGYLLVLVLDSIIGLTLYVVLKPANKKLATYTGALRLLYAGLLIIGVFAFVFQFIDAYDYGSIKLVGYIFFGLHLLVLGYAVFKSGYIPKILGVLLIIASFTYAVFFVDQTGLPEALLIGIMMLILIAELSLSIWLIVKRKSLPEKV